MIEVRATGLEGLAVIEPRRHDDERGFLLETFNAAELASAAGIERRWVQDNHSRSAHNVLRGIHYQLSPPQGKLVRCARGAVFDVAVDLRRSSATFGSWFGVELDDLTHRQMWIPEGFGHGFLVLSEVADVEYKLTAYFNGESGHAVAWDDPDIGVEWPLGGARPILSSRDSGAPPLAEAVVFD